MDVCTLMIRVPFGELNDGDASQQKAKKKPSAIDSKIEISCILSAANEDRTHVFGVKAQALLSCRYSKPL